MCPTAPFVTRVPWDHPQLRQCAQYPAVDTAAGRVVFQKTGERAHTTMVPHRQSRRVASDTTLNAKFRTYRIKALFDEQAEGYLHPSLTKITKAPKLLSKQVGDNIVLLPVITGDDATHVYHGTVSGFPGVDAVIQRFGRPGDKRGSLLLQMTLQLQHVIKVSGWRLRCVFFKLCHVRLLRCCASVRVCTWNWLWWLPTSRGCGFQD